MNITSVGSLTLSKISVYDLAFIMNIVTTKLNVNKGYLFLLIIMTLKKSKYEHEAIKPSTLLNKFVNSH